MSNKVSDLGNTEYRYACDTLLFPIIEEYQPELIIISCGFDSAIHDFLGWSNVTPMMYEYMTRKLGAISPKLLVVQEGGYNIDYLGQHASGVVQGLLGKPETLTPTKADLDGGLKLTLTEEIYIKAAKDWAKENVETTRGHLEGCWKATTKNL
jgi:acetoin utilization deacetylase AcuC-like enzyme